jgi:hypothetical protein
MTAEMILNVHMHESNTQHSCGHLTHVASHCPPSIHLLLHHAFFFFFFLFFWGGGEASWSLPVFSCIQQQSKTSYHSVIHTVSFKLIIYISSHLFCVHYSTLKSQFNVLQLTINVKIFHFYVVHYCVFFSIIYRNLNIIVIKIRKKIA